MNTIHKTGEKRAFFSTTSNLPWFPFSPECTTSASSKGHATELGLQRQEDINRFHKLELFLSTDTEVSSMLILQELQSFYLPPQCPFYHLWVFFLCWISCFCPQSLVLTPSVLRIVFVTGEDAQCNKFILFIELLKCVFKEVTNACCNYFSKALQLF